MGTREKRHKLIVLAFLLVIAATWLLVVLPDVDQYLSVERVEELIERYGYFVLVLLVFIGNIGVPVPEETATLLAGFAARKGLLDYKWVVLVCTLSAIAGDNLGYLIGHTGGRRLIVKYGEIVGVSPKRLERFEGFFKRHGAKTVFLARFIAGMRFLAGPSSGAARMPFRRFFAFNALGAVTWVVAMTQIGYHLGPAFLKILEKDSNYVLLGIGLIIIGYFLIRKIRARKAAYHQ